MPAAKANSVLAGESVTTRGAAKSHAGVSNSRAVNALCSDLATRQVLHQIFHHQGGLFGGDGEELVEAKMRLLVSDV